MPRLRRSDPNAPGIARARRGRGFEYFAARGDKVADPATLSRIRSLAIPPAWRDVWICQDERGHLQATGTDDAGRLQYRYHDDWRRRRDAEKFDRMLRFAQRLPALRAGTDADLGREALDRERVLACAIRLLDRGFFRIGSEAYAAQNDTFGLATIRKEHVRVRGSTVTFEYRAKGGLDRAQTIEDPSVATVIGPLRRRRGGGDELLAFREGRTWVDVRSEDINADIKLRAGEEFTAKDFRTWHATVLAALAVAQHTDGSRSKTARKRVVSQTGKTVAAYLGNTPAVARSSYIDPRVFDRFRSGWTVAPTIELVEGELPEEDLQFELEGAVIDLLEDRHSGGIERLSPAA